MVNRVAFVDYVEESYQREKGRGAQEADKGAKGRGGVKSAQQKRSEGNGNKNCACIVAAEEKKLDKVNNHHF